MNPDPTRIRLFSAVTLKGQCHEIFCFWFFYESVSPQPQSIPFGPLHIFLKIRGYIRKSRCTTGINNTGCKIDAGINDTGGKFATVSTTPATNFANSFASVVDTGGKFNADVSDSGGKFATGVSDTGGK
jgi:hypothetical protein